MLKVPLKIESWGVSDVGLTRPNNEDAWAIAAGGKFFALADGMGGHQAGEVASRETIFTLCKYMDRLLAKEEKRPLEQLMRSLSEGIQETNRKIYSLSLQNPEMAGMGTTLSCFLLHDQLLVTAHVGDSRIYRYRGALEQISKDHIIRLEGPNSSTRKMITRAIGTSSSVEPDLGAFPVLADDIYFLCSDGLSDFVTAAEIALILRKAPSIQDACRFLITAAKAKNSTDNITIVMIKISL